LNTRYREDRALNRFEGWVLRRHTGRAEEAYREWMKTNGARIVNRVRAEFLEAYSISSQSAAQLTSEQKVFKKYFNKGRRELEHEFGKTMRYRSVRDMAGDESGSVVMKLKPIWLMSPLSISDTLPLEAGQFDVVIFDEASQIKLEEAVPTVFRSAQVIVVGDEMQLPPTNFFSGTNKSEDEILNVEEGDEVIEYDLSAESFLSHAAQNLPSTLLGWHYRSRHEALISYSNNAFYSGELLTIPDRKAELGGNAEILVNSAEQASDKVDDLLARSISFHFLEHGVYGNRRNLAEAEYIAQTVRELLSRETKLSFGIVAFSEAQQDEIETALSRLARLDEEFANCLAAEFEREEENQFCGLFVKNLENVQGDERDVIILSICYAPDMNGDMRMNFGPINQSGGEKRLNVIFSRAKIHMVVVSSIKHHQITNEHNDGANCLKGFLEYSSAVSRGDAGTAERVLNLLNTRADFGPATNADETNIVIQQMAEALVERGYEVSKAVGQSRFKTDLAVRDSGSILHQVGILIDGEDHYSIDSSMERYLLRPGILRAFGWTILEVLAKDWYHAREDVLNKIEKLLNSSEVVLDEERKEADEEI
ncbi:MAG: DNA helicase, partial [Verrucomicrobia bacterium]|nr:DNA helicase [Verrucomicrobiota bacterium]